MISYIITSKNEPHLQDTVQSLEVNMMEGAEILAEEDDGRGQRAMINKLVAQSKHNIVCKVDAHCCFGPSFDKHLLEDFDDKTVIAPNMFPLDDHLWTINHHNPMSNFAFDTKYIMNHIPNKEEQVHEVMCMQGSFFMVSKQFFYDAELCDESLGSWGSQAVEIGIQTWMNGGRCLTSKKTYYGHVFRHSEKEFPYKRDKAKIDQTYANMRDKFKDLDIRWLIKKFAYPLDHEV
jgi:hypothetical protein